MTTFTLDVDPDAVDRAAQQVEGLRDDLETHRAGVVAAPDRMAQGWTGGAATSVRAEVTALGGHLQTFPAHLTTASTALRDLATAYREALDVTLPALQQRWDAAEQAYTDAVASSADRRAEDVAAIPADAGAQRRMWQDEAQQAHASRVSTAAGARTGTQAAVTGDYEDLVEDLRQATRTASTALAGAVVGPVGDETVSTYLATGQTSLGTLPPAELADLSLAQQHQVAEDLESASSRVEQDIAAGELDEAALDELDALLAFTGGRVLLADAARDAREQVAGAMADVGRSAVGHEADGDDGAAAADVTLLGTLLARYGEDEDMTTPFLTDLTGEGTLDLTLAVDRLSAGDPAANPLLAHADALRTAVMTSSHDPAFASAAFATALVQRAAGLASSGAEGAPGTALAYLLDGEPRDGDGDGGYGSFFLAAAVEEMVEAEQDFAGEPGRDGSGLWLQGMYQVSHLATTFEGYGLHPEPGSPAANHWDPTLAAVRHLAQDSLAGRDVLAGETGEYLFGDRTWRHDGYAAIIAAGAHAATDAEPGTVGWDGASAVASTMVNELGRRDDVAGDDPVWEGLSGTSSAQLAQVLATHMAAAQEAVLVGGTVEGGRIDTRHVNAALGGDPETDRFTIALLDRAALEAFTGLAAQHGDGVAVLREGLNRYQGLLAEGTAQQVLGPDVDPALRQEYLNRQMGASGTLEAFFGNEVGQQAEMAGKERDDAVRFWVDAASFGVDQGSSALGGVPHPAAKLGSIVIGQVSDPAVEAMKDAWATAEAEAATAGESAAQVSADRVTYGYLQALHNEGVLSVEGLPPSALGDDGHMVDWADLDPDDVRLVLGRFDNDFSGPVSASSQEVGTAMQAEDEALYEDWTAE